MATIPKSEQKSDLGLNGGEVDTSMHPSATIHPADPFSNLDDLRLGQNFGEVVGVKKTITTIPVRKPSRQDFTRVHPDPDYRLETAVLEVKDEREVFLVDRVLWSELMGEISPRVLFTCVN